LRMLDRNLQCNHVIGQVHLALKCHREAPVHLDVRSWQEFLVVPGEDRGGDKLVDRLNSVV